MNQSVTAVLRKVEAEIESTKSSADGSEARLASHCFWKLYGSMSSKNHLTNLLTYIYSDINIFIYHDEDPEVAETPNGNPISFDPPN